MKKNFNHYSGYTLIELLIGMALGIALSAMVLPAFLSNVNAFKSVKSVARTHENARFALTELAKSLRNTGFRGCDSGVTSISNLTGSTIYDFAQTIEGQERAADEAIAGLSNTLTLTSAADAVIVKTLSLVDGILAADVPANATTMTLSSGHDVSTGDVIFVGDCENGYLFSISNVNSSTITLGQAVPASASFTGGTLVYRFDSTTYFLAASQLYTNNQGDTPNSLWRKVNGGAEEEMVAGIENLQIVYGLDSDNDGVPNQFVDGAGVSGNFNSVSIVRFQVLASSLDALPNSGGVLQKAFSMSVNLRNFSG